MTPPLLGFTTASAFIIATNQVKSLFDLFEETLLCFGNCFQYISVSETKYLYSKDA